MRHGSLILLAVVLLVLSSLACSVPGGQTPTETIPLVEPTAAPTAVPTLLPTQVPPTEPPPAPTVPVPTKAAPVEPVAEGATLEIINESDVEIWYVYLSPSKSDSWGEDWLDNDIIRPGESYVITGIPSGVYDVRVEGQDEVVLESWWTVDIVDEMSWTVTGMVTFEITNYTGEAIYYLYISPSDSDVWGEDWLGEYIIEPDMTYTVTGIPFGIYDIQARNQDDETIETLYSADMQGEWYWDVVGRDNLPDNAVLRFEDDFVDNRNDWGGVDNGDVLYRTPANGEFCMLIRTPGLTAWEWYEPFRTDEFIAETSCYYDYSDARCGLGFGPDGDNLYWFEVSAYDQSYALFLLENDEWQDSLIPWTSSNNINPSGENVLSLERVDGMVSVYINGVLQEEVASDRFPTGRLGVGGATYDDGNVEVCLGDLRVWRLE